MEIIGTGAQTDRHIALGIKDNHCAGVARHRPRRTATSVRLTPRQVQVVQLLCQGMTNKSIAGALGCSPRTVEFHISCLFRVLGLETRSALVVHAMTNQLTALPIHR